MFPKKITFSLFIALFLLGNPFILQAVTASKAMVVTSDPRATQAALEVLKKGGNAADAVVAAQWVLNVAEPQISGLGGGGFFLFYDIGTQRITLFDGTSQAPEEAFPEMFLDDHDRPYPFWPDQMSGGFPVGIPATLKLLQDVQARFGSNKISFESLFDPAIELAEKGVEVSGSLSSLIEKHQERLKLFDATAKIFFKEGRPLKAGEMLVQPELASTFRLIQKKGYKSFYDGEIAKIIVKTIREESFFPGLMTAKDLAKYQILERNPVYGRYQGYDIFSAGAPSASGPVLLESLQILENFGLTGFKEKPENYHLIAEAQKVAFSDEVKIADPDFSKVPEDLLISPEWAKQQAGKIQFSKVIRNKDFKRERQEKIQTPQASYVLIVDQWGNRAVYATTLGDPFGSAVVVPGYGFLLNNQLAHFDADPNHKDADPEVSNLAEGEKSPRVQIAPVFVFREGKLWLMAGSSGNVEDAVPALITVLVQMIDFENSPEDALRSARVLDRDGLLEMEPELYKNSLLKVQLELWGHYTLNRENIGNVQMIYFDDSGKITGESDPRGKGEAAGF